MNLAVGGNYLGNPSTNSINTNSVFPGDMQVDYVRLYDQTGPLKISIVRSNATAILTWPANIVCHLQAQTNSASAGASTNWSDVAGASSPFVVNPHLASVFYRLASP
jgi:hypothetical protein